MLWRSIFFFCRRNQNTVSKPPNLSQVTDKLYQTIKDLAATHWWFVVVQTISPHRWSYDQNIHSKVKPRAGIYLVMQYVKYSISIKENWTRSAPQFELQFTVHQQQYRIRCTQIHGTYASHEYCRNTGDLMLNRNK